MRLLRFARNDRIACGIGFILGVGFALLAWLWPEMVSAQPEEYSDLGSLDHCQELFPVEEPGVEELIADLVEITESRKLSGPQDPVYLLVIDDLTALLPFLDERSFSRLYWLIRHGPRYRVWTLAGLAAEQANQLDGRFLSAFRTRLFGFMHNERQACLLAGDESLATSDLEKGLQFLVPYGGDWLRFWLCEPDSHDLDGDRPD